MTTPPHVIAGSGPATMTAIVQDRYGPDPEDLLRTAERDMRRRKRTRRDGPPLRWYDEREALREMMDQGLVEVAFQPLVQLATGDIVGYEALVRAHHQELGAFSPLALFKLLAFVDPGTSSGAAMRAGLVAEGGLQGLLRGGSAGSSAASTGRS